MHYIIPFGTLEKGEMESDWLLAMVATDLPTHMCIYSDDAFIYSECAFRTCQHCINANDPDDKSIGHPCCTSCRVFKAFGTLAEKRC